MTFNENIESSRIIPKGKYNLVLRGNIRVLKVNIIFLFTFKLKIIEIWTGWWVEFTRKLVCLLCLKVWISTMIYSICGVSVSTYSPWVGRRLIILVSKCLYFHCGELISSMKTSTESVPCLERVVTFCPNFFLVTSVCYDK